VSLTFLSTGSIWLILVRGVDPEATCRPPYHPSVLLSYIYGYLNRVQSSRRLEREAGRQTLSHVAARPLNPDHKTIADSARITERDCKVCAQFVALCRELGLRTQASVAVDGSKFSGQ